MNAPSPSASPFKIVDLFAGPGGLDQAARQLGVPSVGIEWDKDACATRTANDLQTESGDVRDFGPTEFPEDFNVLAGGPPCQTFTVAGKGAGRRALDHVLSFADRLRARDSLTLVRKDLAALKDEETGKHDDRTGLVLEPLRWALDAIDAGRPFQAIVLEQVPAVLPVWKRYAEILRAEGYLVATPRVLHTEEYGVPQTRRRAILIARRIGEDSLLRGDPHMPEPTHNRYDKRKSREEHGLGLEPWVRMQDVLTRRRTPFTVVSNYGTGGDPKARGQRGSHEPAATVTGKISRNRIVGPDGRDQPRLTESEAGQLQTFPAAPDWIWAGAAVAQQIGNAVPPRLGMHVLAAALDLDRARLDENLKTHYTY
ncbi:DNA cytosine methyltransferase [Streptomyces sp. SID14478]|uniref:DNA cytosine methyltransferase n=1 Tax=Streptomyces sp. SID14478 TaxID=2706073 RepID=UPI0013DC9D3B|nr:DNA cytosine methyltransferase [Streptomyces sp. SID14478]NEB74374.1 DNA cytosine methyltransferase [Streptomyces sp. SID14478]